MSKYKQLALEDDNHSIASTNESIAQEYQSPEQIELEEKQINLLVKVKQNRRAQKKQVRDNNKVQKEPPTERKSFPEAKYPQNSVIAKRVEKKKGKKPKCKKCKSDMVVGDIAIGVQGSFFNMVNWRHLECFCIARKYFLYDVDSIIGINELGLEDRNIITDYFQGRCQTSLETLGKKKKKKILKKYKDSKYQEQETQVENQSGKEENSMEQN